MTQTSTTELALALEDAEEALDRKVGLGSIRQIERDALATLIEAASPLQVRVEIEQFTRFLHERFRQRTTGVSGRRIMPLWENQLPEYQAIVRGDAAAILEFLDSAKFAGQ